MVFHYTVDTNKTIDEAIHDLQEALKKEEFGVLWELDMKDTLESKGLDFDRDFRVLEICNPKAAKEVLEQNHQVRYLLPCKIVVYEDHGRTKIGMPKPTVLMKLTKDKSLVRFAKDIEKRLASCINHAK